MINNVMKFLVFSIIILPAVSFIIPLALYFLYSIFESKEVNDHVIGGTILPTSISVFGVSVYPSITSIVLIVLGMFFYLMGFLYIFKPNNSSNLTTGQITTKNLIPINHVNVAKHEAPNNEKK